MAKSQKESLKDQKKHLEAQKKSLEAQLASTEGELVSVERELGSVEEELELASTTKRNPRNDGLTIVERYHGRMSHNAKRFSKESGLEGLGRIQPSLAEVGSSLNIPLPLIATNDEVEHNGGTAGDSRPMPAMRAETIAPTQREGRDGLLDSDQNLVRTSSPPSSNLPFTSGFTERFL